MDQPLPSADPKCALLDDLARLRAVGMGMAETIGRLTDAVAAEETQEAVADCGVLSLAFSRVARGVRQIVAIEHELMGGGELGKLQAKRNAQTAEALRLRVGGIVRHRVPQIDREYLKGLLSDLFSDYDDYGDVDLTDIKPLIVRVCDRLGVDYNPDLWPESAQGIRIGEALLDPNERDGELDQRIAKELDQRIAKELDRIHEWHKSKGRVLPDEYWEGFGGHDPP